MLVSCQPNNCWDYLKLLGNKLMLRKTTGAEVIDLFHAYLNLARISTAHKTKIQTNKEVSCLKSLRCYIYHAYKC